MRTASEITTDIKARFLQNTGKEYRATSGIGYFTDAVSRSLEDIYREIENAKNPHIYTNLSGENLDKMGVFVNVPRNANESDNNYLYRMMNWTHLKAGATYTAVNDSLLDLEYASNAEYFPGIHGAGTGVIYVIPNDYSNATITAALEEAKARVELVLSPESYTEFIIPTAIPVIPVALIKSENGDLDYLKINISNEIETYINSIPPYEKLSVGQLNLIGMSYDNVDYFSISGIFINNNYVTETSIIQTLEEKMLFQEMSWED